MSNQMNDLPFRQIGIDGFRGLRQLRLERLGRINLLVGANNSGKTSVLEALSLICQPGKPAECLAMIRRRDFGGLDESRLQSLRWCFAKRDTESPDFLSQSANFGIVSCNFSVTGKTPLRHLQITFSEFTGQPANEPLPGSSCGSSEFEEHGLAQGAELAYLSEWETSPKSSSIVADSRKTSIRLWEGSDTVVSVSDTQRTGIESETITPYSYQINRIQVKSLSNQKFFDGALDVTDLLREFDADVLKVEVASIIGERPAIYIQHKKLGWAPLSIFGDAMRRALLLASILPRLRGGVLLIDEIEVGIHISALQRVFKWLHDAARSLGIQVFVTTHSLDALDAMLAVCSDTADEEVVAFHLQQGEQQTECKRFAGPLLNRLRFERGLDVRL